jgi:type IV pilus assembly protein PilC
MKFTYTAKNPQGEIQRGVIESGSRDTALSMLQGYGLVVLKIQQEAITPWYAKLLSGFKRASLKDISLFTRQFATLLGAQIPLIDSLRTMFQQSENVYLKEAAFDIATDVEAGSSLSQAFSQHEGLFSRFYVEMVKSAEITGRLEEVFSYLADYYESQAVLVDRIRNAMIYPAFVFGLFAIVVFVMITMVIPQLASILIETEVPVSQLPFASRILFGLGSFTTKYGWVTLSVILAGFLMFRAYFRSQEGKTLVETSLLSFPFVGDMAKKVYLARFSETLSVMITGGIPVAQALEVCGDVVGNISYQESIKESAEAVKRGELVSEALGHWPDKFTPLIVQMISIGEKTGRLDELLARASKFYTREVERSLASLTELIQPIMIVVLGIFVGLLIGAVILPIYQIAQTF